MKQFCLKAFHVTLGDKPMKQKRIKKKAYFTDDWGMYMGFCDVLFV